MKVVVVVLVVVAIVTVAVPIANRVRWTLRKRRTHRAEIVAEALARGREKQQTLPMRSPAPPPPGRRPRQARRNDPAV